jgi:hypothetical protein
MTVSVTKPAVNLREKLSELDFDKVPFQKMPAGSVLQVVSETIDSGWVSTSSSTMVSSNIGLSITPKRSDSRIIIDYHFPMTHIPTTGSSLVTSIYKNGTDLRLNNYPQGFIHNSNGAPQYPSISIKNVDTVTSTQTTTYTVYFRSTVGGTTVHLAHNGSEIHLVLMEIAA